MLRGSWGEEVLALLGRLFMLGRLRVEVDSGLWSYRYIERVLSRGCFAWGSRYVLV